MIERLLRVPFVAGIAAVILVYAGFAVYCHQRAAMAPDESFYAVAAHDVYAGRALYEDFAYTQMPLYPYIDGAILRATSGSLFAHRIVNAIWGLLTLIVAMWIVHYETRAFEPTMLAGFLLAISPRWVSLQTLAVWCAPSGAFLVLAFATAIVRGHFWRRVVLFALFSSIACGCRLTSAPVIAAMSLLFAIDGGVRRWLLAAAIVVAACAIPVLPFLIQSTERFLFDVWGYHVSSARPRDLRIQAGQWWNMAPAVTTCTAAALFALPRLARARDYRSVVLLFTAAVGLVVPVLPPTAWGVYAAASVPLAAIAATAVFHSLEEWHSPLRFAAWASLVLPLFVVLAPMTTRSPSDEVTAMVEFIERNVPEGPLLTSFGVVAAEADRPLIPNTEMGPFSAMAPADAAVARRMGFTTLPELTKKVEAREPAAVVRASSPEPTLEWNFRWAVPSMDRQDPDDIEAYERAIEDCYSSAFDTGSMELLVRKERCDVAAKE